MAKKRETPRMPEKELDRLYHGPLEEFTAARNELAKSLRSDGETEAAERVKSIHKPSRAAWLVNQLSVRKSTDVDQLLKAGEALRAAQEEMLAGSPDRSKLREVARRQQEKIDSLLATAEAIGREHGVGSQILTRVGETLQAAAGDPDLAEAIRRGHLEREQRAAGIGLLSSATPAAPARRKGSKDRDAAERRARQQQAKRRQAAERKLAAAERKVDREKAKLERAHEAVEDAERSLHDAELDSRAVRRELEELGE